MSIVSCLSNLSENIMEKKLIRVSNGMFLGVCGGVAKYFGVDATLIRVLWAVAAFVGFGTPVLAYFVMAFIMPKEV